MSEQIITEGTAVPEVFKNIDKLTETRRVANAYLLSGENAQICFMAAEYFAKKLVKSPADLLYPSHEKPNLFSVDDIRETINQTVHIKPYESEYKVYIVRDADKMNVQAQNALLKTLEEPPAYVVIILIAENLDVFLPTILSRCVKFTVCENGESRADSDEAEQNVRERVTEVLSNITDMDPTALHGAAASMDESKLFVKPVFETMRTWFRDVLVYKMNVEMAQNGKFEKNTTERTIINQNRIEKIQRCAKEKTYSGICKILEEIDTAESRLESNVNTELTYEMLFMAFRDMR